MKGLFAGYMFGYLIAIGAFWWGLRSLEFVSPPWPSVVALALVGLGIVYALSRSQTHAARKNQSQMSGHSSGNGPSGQQRGQGGQQRDSHA